MTTFLLLLLAVILGSAATLGGAAVVYRARYHHRFRQALDREIEVIAERLHNEVKAGVLAGIDDADFSEEMAELESRVRKGVEDAFAGDDIGQLIEEWSGDIEDRVRTGVLAALTSLPRSDVIRDATLNVTEAGSSLLTESLNAWLGLGARPRPPPDTGEDE